jgi:hypothetical protein
VSALSSAGNFVDFSQSRNDAISVGGVSGSHVFDNRMILTARIRHRSPGLI